MVHCDMGGPDPPPPTPPGEGEESGGAPPPPDPTAAALELQGLSLEDERPLEEEDGDEAKTPEAPHSLGVRAPQVPERLEIQGKAVTSSGRAVTSETMTSEAAVTSGGQLMFSHRTDRRLILLDPQNRDPPCVLALRSSVQGAIGLQRVGSLPRRRGERGDPSPAPRPHSHHGQGVLALQLNPESYSACLHLAELERRVREALAERERLLRAREARRAAKAPPPPEPAPPPPEPDLLGALRARGHAPERCPSPRVSAGACRGALAARGEGRLRRWRRRWFVLEPRRGALRYFRDKEETKLKGVIALRAIQEVFCDLGGAARTSPNPRLTFCLKTDARLFCLAAPSPEALRIWMDAILSVSQGAGPA